MPGLERLDQYMEQGYTTLRWVRESPLFGDLQIVLGNKKGDVVCLVYDISTDSLTGGHVYKNKGLERELIQKAEEEKDTLDHRVIIPA